MKLSEAGAGGAGLTLRSRTSRAAENVPVPGRWVPHSPGWPRARCLSEDAWRGVPQGAWLSLGWKVGNLVWGPSLVGRGRSRFSWGVGLKNNDSQPSHRVGNSAVCREGQGSKGAGAAAGAQWDRVYKTFIKYLTWHFLFETICYSAFTALISFKIPASRTNRKGPLLNIVLEGNSWAAHATSV